MRTEPSPGSVKSWGHRFGRLLTAAVAMGREDYAAALMVLDEETESWQQIAPGRTAMRVAWLRGKALAQLNRNDEAGASFTDAIREARWTGSVSRLWRGLSDEALLLSKQGQRDAARERATEAAELIEKVAARIPGDALRANFSQRALGPLASLLRRRGRRAVDGLTEREAEIAAYVAQGLTNRGIADELVLSARTVETHIANAIAKLGFNSRSQLAAWAVEHGLNEPEA
jgi:DNA-binding NarL/FixJ family response regulator